MATQIPQLINRTSGSSANTFTIPSMDTTSANFLVAITTVVATKAPAVISDSKSNTWTGLTAKTFTGQQTTQIFYVTNPTVGASHTFTLTGTSILASLIVFSFSGITITSPFDKQNGAISSGTTTTLQPGSITPTNNGELIVTGFSTGANLTTLGDPSIDPLIASIYTTGTEVPVTGGINYGTWAGFAIQQTAATTNPTWTASGGTGINLNGIAVIASFVAAPASSSGQKGYASS